MGEDFSADVFTLSNYLSFDDYKKIPSPTDLSTEKQADWYKCGYLCNAQKLADARSFYSMIRCVAFFLILVAFCSSAQKVDGRCVAIPLSSDKIYEFRREKINQGLDVYLRSHRWADVVRLNIQATGGEKNLVQDVFVNIDSVYWPEIQCKSNDKSKSILCWRSVFHDEFLVLGVKFLNDDERVRIIFDKIYDHVREDVICR